MKKTDPKPMPPAGKYKGVANEYDSKRPIRKVMTRTTK